VREAGGQEEESDLTGGETGVTGVEEEEEDPELAKERANTLRELKKKPVVGEVPVEDADEALPDDNEASGPEDETTAAGKDWRAIVKGYRTRHGEEDMLMKSWRRHRRHFFILSSAGKPIYSRYGNEQMMSTFMGIIQALISFIADEGDTLRTVVAHRHKFVFLLKGHIYLVAVTRVFDSENQLREQLNYLYSHIVSVLTLSQLTKIFQQRNNFDLRNLLGVSDNYLLDNLTCLMEVNPSFILGSIQCLRMPSPLRSAIGNVLQANKPPDLLYAILMVDYRLVTLLRPRRHSLHPSDLHLLFNLVSTSGSLKAGESWVPICLPKFNNKGFLHAHVSFVDSNCSLMLISTDRDRFFEMSQSRNDIIAALTSGGHLKDLKAAVAMQDFSVKDINIPSLRHFLYKSKSTVQFTAPILEPPYNTLEQQKRLLRLYQYIHHRTHLRTRPLKIHYATGQSEVVLGWLAAGFELYAVFGPMVTKTTAITSVNNLLRWIKKEEESLFILNSPVF